MAFCRVIDSNIGIAISNSRMTDYPEELSGFLQCCQIYEILRQAKAQSVAAKMQQVGKVPTGNKR